MKRKINRVIAVLCFLIAALVWYGQGVREGWPWMAVALIAGMLHLIWSRGRYLGEWKSEIPVSRPRLWAGRNPDGTGAAW